MKNQIEIEKIDIPVRAALKNEAPRRSHKNLTKFWLEHENDYEEYPDFFPE